MRPVQFTLNRPKLLNHPLNPIRHLTPTSDSYIVRICELAWAFPRDIEPPRRSPTQTRSPSSLPPTRLLFTSDLLPSLRSFPLVPEWSTRTASSFAIGILPPIKDSKGPPQFTTQVLPKLLSNAPVTLCSPESVGLRCIACTTCTTDIL